MNFPLHKSRFIIEKFSGGSEAAELLSILHPACFAKGWSHATISTMLGQPAVVCYIAVENLPEQPSNPIGFLVARAAADEAEILTIGVLESHRKLGVALQFMVELTRSLSKLGIKSIFLEVAVSNQAARSLYNKLGFSQVATRPNYYPLANGKREDALVLQRSLLV